MVLKKVFFLVFTTVFSVFTGFFSPVFAQTGQRLLDLLEIQELSWASAASLVLEASDHGTFSDSDAFSYAMEKGWLPRRSQPEENAQLGGIALLLMQSFDIKGGVMYSMFRNQRYAYRELVYRNIIIGRTWPSMTVSGDTLIFMTGRFLAIREAEEAIQPGEDR